MACNTLSVACSSPASVTAYAPLSSASAPFVASSAPAMQLCPLSSPSHHKSALSVSCSLSEKDAPMSSMGKALLTGLVAAGAALSVFTADTATFAASGPGNSGAERTAQKAQDLLKAADKLNVEDAPKRYGPGRVTAEGNQDAGKISQDAGGKAMSQIQDGISSIAGNLGGKKGEVEGAAKNVASQAQGAAKNVASQAQSKVDDATGNSGPGGLFSSISGNFGGKKGEVEGAAKNVASQAQSKVDDATGNSGPGGLFSSIKDSFQGVKDSVAQKDGDAKKVLDEATSNVKSSVKSTMQ